METFDSAVAVEKKPHELKPCSLLFRHDERGLYRFISQRGFLSFDAMVSSYDFLKIGYTFPFVSSNDPTCLSICMGTFERGRRNWRVIFSYGNTYHGEFIDREVAAIDFAVRTIRKEIDKHNKVDKSLLELEFLYFGLRF